jgi:hypothetical protein
MNEEDKAIARRAIEENRLTIEQVEEIRAVVDRTGRSFQDVAADRGLLALRASSPLPAPPDPPGRKVSLFYELLILATLLIVLGVPVSIWRLIQTSKKDADLAIESDRSNAESDHKAANARRGYYQSLVTARESEAAQQLAKARAAMTRVDSMLSSGTLPPELTVALNEAFVAYNMYLRVFPDDAAVCVERARTHEMRRNYDLAVSDLEHALSIQPALEPALRDRIAKAKQMLARKPQ